MEPASHAPEIHAVPSEWASRAYLDNAGYRAMYEASVRDPEAFWHEHGSRIDWFTPYSQARNSSFGPGEVSIRWYGDGPIPWRTVFRAAAPAW